VILTLIVMRIMLALLLSFLLLPLLTSPSFRFQRDAA